MVRQNDGEKKGALMWKMKIKSVFSKHLSTTIKGMPGVMQDNILYTNVHVDNQQNPTNPRGLKK